MSNQNATKWRNQISKIALLNYMLQSNHSPWEPYSQSVFHSSCSSGKDILGLLSALKQWCNALCDKTLNMIGPHCIVQWNTACMPSSTDPGSVGTCSTGNDTPYPTCPLTNLNIWCQVFQLTVPSFCESGGSGSQDYDVKYMYTHDNFWLVCNEYWTT